MITAHIISRRPSLLPRALQIAQDRSDRVVVGLHGYQTETGVETLYGDDYAELTNRVLKAAGPSIRIDDDDWYPPDHAEIFKLWKPGHTVWGLCEVRACDGTTLITDHPDMCAGVIPPVKLTADHRGRLAESLRAKTKPIYAPTGVIKLVCLADTSWLHNPAWRRIGCRHSERAVLDS